MPNLCGYFLSKTFYQILEAVSFFLSNSGYTALTCEVLHKLTHYKKLDIQSPRWYHFHTIPTKIVAYKKDKVGDSMKLSTRSLYGLKAVVDIAAEGDNKCVSIKKMADRLKISENYLEQLIIKLKKAGILSSVRGAGGGYIMKHDPAGITVGQILNILEGSLLPSKCLANSDSERGDGEGCALCVTRGVWEKIHESVTNVVESITIMDLVNEHRQLNGDDKNV